MTTNQFERHVTLSSAVLTFTFLIINLPSLSTAFAAEAPSKSLSSEQAPRQRISLNAGWKFHEYESTEKADDLIYDVRPKIEEKDYTVADAKPTEAVKVEATQPVLKPWILPTGNDFIKDPAQRRARPDGNPGGDFPFVQTKFDDSAWESLNLPHDCSRKHRAKRDNHTDRKSRRLNGGNYDD